MVRKQSCNDENVFPKATERLKNFQKESNEASIDVI